MALQSNIKKAKKTSDELSELLDQLGKLLDRTKVMYEQYFMGIQKMPPAQLHRDIERRIRELTQQHIRNTALRFRFATLSQKFGSYNTYWKRTMRKIERGEYARDVRRASQRMLRKGEEIPEELLVKLPKRMRDRILRDREAVARRRQRQKERDEAGKAPESRAGANDRGVFELGGDGDDLDIDAIFAQLEAKDPEPAAGEPAGAKDPEPAAQAPPEPQKPPAPPPLKKANNKFGGKRARRPSVAKFKKKPGARPPSGMSESRSRELFEQYAKARKLVGDKRPVSYDQLMKKIGQQAPKIMRQHNARAVDFSVVIKGDKVVLKAKPKS